MNNQFSPRVNQILIYSKEEAERLQSRTIEPGHLFLGMLRENSGKAIEILNKFHLRLDKYRPPSYTCRYIFSAKEPKNHE